MGVAGQVLLASVTMSETHFQMVQKKHPTWNKKRTLSRNEVKQAVFSYRIEYLLRNSPGLGSHLCFWQSGWRMFDSHLGRNLVPQLEGTSEAT